ncbi:MAG: sigma-54 dependent transcriptional regulator [candidate division KSB1 bacterium]|jgi:two-component system NtrC family response regulator|nr:sigma-54 dependent transcriptional regulator [candidate division KSB1 bacterium]
MLSILIIDDEESQLISLKSFLGRRGHEIYTATDGLEGIEIAREKTIDLVLSDYRMPGLNGLEVLKKIKSINPIIDVVIMTAYGSLSDAVDIMKAGAYDYLTKPINLDELENLISRVQEKHLLISENRILRSELQNKFRFDAIISQSGEMEQVLNTAARVAPSKATVLIRGESGTGKELVARAIHYASPRKDKSFVIINVAALSENLLESELFGHEKGAFTGATHTRIGRFEEAHDGTLFIDEVGDISLSTQVKLLRAIQFGQIERIGSNETRSVNVRIVAATHRNLEELIESGQFREDLFYRMNVITIWIPPLRKRRSDIPPLVHAFIKKYASENNKDIHGISREAMDYLMKYDYIGNVRELENMIESAVVLCRGDQIGLRDLPEQVQIPSKSANNPQDLSNGYTEKLRQFESEMLTEALQQSNGNKSAAARLLGITERHFRSRLEKLGMK